MPKTPEQAEADNLFEEAVKRVIAAYGIVPDGSMVADYFVIGEAVRFDDDGDSTCDMFLAFRNGHVRLTTALGMMDLGRKQLFAQYVHNDDYPDNDE